MKVRSIFWIAFGAAAAIGGCNCEQDTGDLGLGDLGPGGLDASPTDARFDSGFDTGPGACTIASECPGPFPPCDVPAQCHCGTYTTCMNGQCVGYVANDCPVDGGLEDSGTVDGGGGPGSCNNPTECGPPNTRSDPWCGVNGSLMGAWTCLEHRCYWDCDTDRVCELPSNPACVACSNFPNKALMVSCVDPNCSLRTFATRRVAYTNCDPSFATEGTVLSSFPTKARPCATSIATPDQSRILGTVEPYTDGRYYGDFPSLGGLCIGTSLPTGLERIHWACDGCEMVWEN